MKRALGLLGAVAVLAAGLAAASLAGGTSLSQTISTFTGTTGGGHTPVTICHKPGTPAEQTLVVDDDSVELTGHLGHGDTVGACEPTTTTGTVPTTTTPTGTTPTPPGHDCTFTGAGKDGQPGNDDCAPKTTTTVEHGTAQLVCPPGQPIVQTVTVTRTVQSPPKVVTKVVNHVKTRTVYRTRVIVKVKKILVPGMHKNGVEGSG